MIRDREDSSFNMWWLCKYFTAIWIISYWYLINMCKIVVATINMCVRKCVYASEFHGITYVAHDKMWLSEQKLDMFIYKLKFILLPQLIATLNVTVRAKIRLVRTCQYFEKYHFKNSIKKTSLALIEESFTEHNT